MANGIQNMPKKFGSDITITSCVVFARGVHTRSHTHTHTYTHVVSFFRHMSHNMWPLFFLVTLDFFSTSCSLSIFPSISRNKREREIESLLHTHTHCFLLSISFLSPSIIHYTSTKRLKLIKTLMFCCQCSFTFLSLL